MTNSMNLLKIFLLIALTSISFPSQASCRYVSAPALVGDFSSRAAQLRTLAQNFAAEIVHDQNSLETMGEPPSGGGSAGQFLDRQRYYSQKASLESSIKDLGDKQTCYLFLAQKFDGLERYQQRVNNVLSAPPGLLKEAGAFGWRNFLTVQAEKARTSPELNQTLAQYFRTQYLSMRTSLDFVAHYPEKVLRYAFLMRSEQFPATRNLADLQALATAWTARLDHLTQEGISAAHVDELKQVYRQSLQDADTRLRQ